MFFKQLSIQWQYKYLHVHKKTLKKKKKKKKCLRLLNKKTPLYAGLSTKLKTFSHCQATYQKGNFFHRANVQTGCLADIWTTTILK